jgi:adenosylcobinamide-GDP ribazoletransferase
VLIALVLAHATSRLMASVIMQYYPYVSHVETSKSKQVVSLSLSRKVMLLSALPILFLLLVALDWSYCLAFLASLLVVFIMGQYFKKRIGGYTGDCLGAVQQVTEVNFYLVVLMFCS